MSRLTKFSVACTCGTIFDADIYRSVNVSIDSSLKTRILSGQFNLARCPACGRQFVAEVPFLYHDADASVMVWVYPISSAGQAEQIRDRVRRSREMLGTVLPPSMVDNNREVVFGIDELIGWLGEAGPSADSSGASTP